MIKFFKKQDVLLTKYNVSNDKVANNIVSDTLIAGNTTDFYFPIKFDIPTCDNNKSGSCEDSLVQKTIYLQPTIKTDDVFVFQIGKKIDDDVVFYETGSIEYKSTSNPLNLDGTYKSQVYNTTKNMYYNDFNNCYNIFGFDGFDTSKAKLNLSNEFVSFKLKIPSVGNRIRPNSIKIKNQSGDIITDICDDGDNNLFLSGSHFVNKETIKTQDETLTTNLNIGGLGKLYN